MWGKKQTQKSRNLMSKNRIRKYGKENPIYKGGWMSRGYKYLNIQELTPSQKILAKQMTNKEGIPEHRIIMATYLNRPLKREELVHHKNGVKNDNRIKNLEIMNNSTKKK